MSSQETKKNVPIYFYYLTISKQKDSNDTSTYDIKQIVDTFSKLLSYILAKNLTDRKKDITSSEKVVWLDSYENLKNGNYNIAIGAFAGRGTSGATFKDNIFIGSSPVK